MYSLAERDRRWELARALMDAAGVDALIVYGEPSAVMSPDSYFTGGPPGALVLFPRYGGPLVLGDRPGPWIEDVRPARHAYGLADALKERRLTHARVGVLGLEPYAAEHGGSPLPYTLWATFLGLLPQTVFVPVWSQFVRSAMSQSSEEIAVLAECGRIGAVMADALRAAVRPGADPLEPYAAAMHAGQVRGADPEVRLSCGPGLGQELGPGLGQGLGRGAPLRDGDVVLAELNCRYRGRETHRTLTVPVGPPAPELAPALRAARASHRAGLRALRPGLLFGRVADAMRISLERSGGRSSRPLIRGLNPRGVCGGVEPGPRSPTVGYDLPVGPGMTFALHVTCDLGHGTVTYGDTVVIGSTGPRVIDRLAGYTR
ncbi:M24 family metallopeptidase [Streptomyces sp. NPDC057136]|uniref:M24 family metallopeptidase n=1 Tax=Streptomyces sp. NPDC057136 TaxID=3346029 RepID=UPI003635EE0F